MDRVRNEEVHKRTRIGVGEYSGPESPYLDGLDMWRKGTSALWLEGC